MHAFLQMNAYIYLYVAILVCLQARLSPGTSAIPDSEYFSLSDLYSATNGSQWQWSDEAGAGNVWYFTEDADPCLENWQGVTCSNNTGVYHVVQLELYNYNLQGRLPSSIGNLTFLTFLDLNTNYLSSTIPHTVGNLTQLQRLYLNTNSLTGQMPESISYLGELLELYLYENLLTGPIPQSFRNLSSLQDFDLDTNQLSGSIPDFLSTLSHLKYIYLQTNQFRGTIPEILGNLTQLLSLGLSDNQLTGTLPDFVGTVTPGGLTNMYYFDVAYNGFVGTIPESIYTLQESLLYLILNNNHLTGTLSDELGSLSNLQLFYLSGNIFSAPLPASFTSLSNLVLFYANNSRLLGTIPNNVGNMVNLVELDLSANSFSGTLPQSFITLSLLVSLSLQDNRLTGPLTAFGAAQTSLTTIRLDDNQFTGELPRAMFQIPSLVSLSVVGSCLHGSLPDNICEATELETLVLYGLTTGSSCRAIGSHALSLQRQSFGGSFPQCLLSLPHITTLLLSSNDLTGQLPNELDVTNNLIQLDLSHNSLTGTVPESIQSHIWYLLDLSHNKLSGTLQASSFQDHNLTLHFSNNRSANGEVYASLSLDTNRLSGRVPNNIKPLSDVSVLAGNLFQCRYDKSDLPQHDSDIANYECASNTFDVSIYVWLGLLALALLCGFVLRQKLKTLRSLLSPAPLTLSEKVTAALASMHAMMTNFQLLDQVAWRGALFCLLVLLPYYAIMSHFEGMHTHQYAYVISAIYTSGVAPFVLAVLFFTFILVSFHYFAVPDSPPAKRKREEIESNVRLRLRCVWFLFAFTNTAVVLGVNVAFVYIVLYESSEAQILAQIALSVFKLAWSTLASPYMMRTLDGYFFPERAAESGNYFTLQLLVALFNNIAIPCLVVAAVDPNCFNDILLPPDAQTVNYILPLCYTDFAEDPCSTISSEKSSLTFTPPFTYSYQCSASFITSYAPAFVYMSISTVFLHPLLLFVLTRAHKRLQADTPAHRALSRLVPRLLKPPSHQVPSVQHFRQWPLIGAVGILVTLLTQLGILLTFGVIFPPVALAMAVSISAVVVRNSFTLQRFVQAAADAQLFGYLEVINTECEGIGAPTQMRVAVRVVICYSCAFYTLFLFDTLGDSRGFAASVWVLVVVPLVPYVVFGGMALWGEKKVMETGADKDVEMSDVVCGEKPVDGHEVGVVNALHETA